MRTLPVVGEIFDSIIEAGHPLPTFQIMHHAYFSKGFLLFITYEPFLMHMIYSNVLEKYSIKLIPGLLIFKKQKAQAMRNRKIQLALERVTCKKQWHMASL
jgi:hypothetical protein